MHVEDVERMQWCVAATLIHIAIRCAFYGYWRILEYQKSIIVRELNLQRYAAEEKARRHWRKVSVVVVGTLFALCLPVGLQLKLVLEHLCESSLGFNYFCVVTGILVAALLYVVGNIKAMYSNALPMMNQHFILTEHPNWAA
jgi:hypothetical protein